MVRYCEESKSKVKTSKLIPLASSVCYLFPFHQIVGKIVSQEPRFHFFNFLKLFQLISVEKSVDFSFSEAVTRSASAHASAWVR